MDFNILFLKKGEKNKKKLNKKKKKNMKCSCDAKFGILVFFNIFYIFVMQKCIPNLYFISVNNDDDYQ